MNSKPSGTTKMTEGSPLKHILLFAVPLFAGNIFQQIYSAVDTAVAGYNLGDKAIAAIGATSALYSLIIDLATGLNSGYSIVISQCFGGGDTEKLKRAIAAAIILNILSAAVMTGVSLIFLKPLMALMNTPAEIFGEGFSYMAVICGGMIFTVIYNMFAGILRALGNSRIPLYCLMISCAVNICLDILFVSVMKTGVAGAAYATIIAEAVSALVCGIFILVKYRHILPQKKHFGFSGGIYRDLIATGVSMGLMYCIVDMGSVIFQRANNSLGEMYISAHTSARRLINIFMQPLGTLATASSTFIGQNYGAGQYGRIKTALKQVVLMEIVWSAFSCGLVWICGGGLIKLTTGTENGEIISTAVLSLRWHLSFFPALGILLCLRTAMQAMGRKTAPVLSSAIELILKIASAVWLIPIYGFLGTCMTEPVIWTAMLIFLSAAFWAARKKIFAEGKNQKEKENEVI